MKKLFILVLIVATLFAKEEVTRLDTIKVTGFDKLKEDLTPEATISYLDNGVRVLELVSVVEFKTDSTVIEKRFVPLLNEWAVYLKKRPQYSIVLIGRADSRGPVEYNKRLSKRRALKIKNYLTNKGVKNKMSIIADGEENDVANNSTPAGMEINRSVEIRYIEEQPED